MVVSHLKGANSQMNLKHVFLLFSGFNFEESEPWIFSYLLFANRRLFVKVIFSTLPAKTIALQHYHMLSFSNRLALTLTSWECMCKHGPYADNYGELYPEMKHWSLSSSSLSLSALFDVPYIGTFRCIRHFCCAVCKSGIYRNVSHWDFWGCYLTAWPIYWC